jgi:hypothetical protein
LSPSLSFYTLRADGANRCYEFTAVIRDLYLNEAAPFTNGVNNAKPQSSEALKGCAARLFIRIHDCVANVKKK